MVNKKITYNAADIEQELNWFREILKTRSLLNVHKETNYKESKKI